MEVTKRLANLVYKVPAGTKITTRYADGDRGIIHQNIEILREKVYEKRDVFDSTDDEVQFMDWGHIIVVKAKDLETYRERRGKLVKIPNAWLGKVTHPQTIRKRKSKKDQGPRYRSKSQR